MKQLMVCTAILLGIFYAGCTKTETITGPERIVTDTVIVTDTFIDHIIIIDTLTIKVPGYAGGFGIGQHYMVIALQSHYDSLYTGIQWGFGSIVFYPYVYIDFGYQPSGYDGYFMVNAYTVRFSSNEGYQVLNGVAFMGVKYIGPGPPFDPSNWLSKDFTFQHP